MGGWDYNYSMINSKKSFLLVLTALVSVIYFTRDVENSPFSARLLATTLDPTRMQTNPVRLPAVEKFCQGTSRGTLISAADSSTNSQYFSIMKMYFKVEMYFCPYPEHKLLDQSSTETSATSWTRSKASWFPSSSTSCPSSLG